MCSSMLYFHIAFCRLPIVPVHPVIEQRIEMFVQGFFLLGVRLELYLNLWAYGQPDLT